MCPCNKTICWVLTAAGAAFLISAMIGSFWVSFALGAVLLAIGFFLRRP